MRISDWSSDVCASDLVSLDGSPSEARRLVPPQASTYGLAAGKSTWLPPSATPSPAPLSPDAAHTVTPITAAAFNASLNARIACAVQEDSGPPQLIEITEGLFLSSCTAALMAPINPASLLSEK